MKHFCFLLFVLAIITSYGQLAVKPISVVSENNDNNLLFPVIVSPQQQVVARKIYSQLLKDALDLPAESTTQQVQDAMQQWPTISYDVLNSTEKVFSIRINRSGMHFNTPLNLTFLFDARTGELIDITKMFTPQLSIVKKLLLEEWKGRIKGHLEGDRADEYKACMEKANEMTELDAEIHFTNNGFEFEGSSCLDVTDWNYERDTRDPFTRSFNQLWFALSPYGLSFFIEPSTAGSALNVVLHGTIDQKYPLSIILFPPAKGSAEVNGLEIYDKFGQNISLKGKADGNKITMQELDNQGKPQATLDGTWDGTKWIGTFTNIKTGKALSLQMTAQR